MFLSLINSVKYSIGIHVYLRSVANNVERFIEKKKTLSFEISLCFRYFEMKVPISNVSLTNVNLHNKRKSMH